MSGLAFRIANRKYSKYFPSVTNCFIAHRCPGAAFGTRGKRIDLAGRTLSCFYYRQSRLQEKVDRSHFHYGLRMQQNCCVSTWGAAAATTAAIATSGIFLVANITFLTSTIPAIFGRGAPYLPTNSQSLSFILDDILPRILSKNAAKPIPTSAESDLETQSMVLPTPITIIDLGSGDGRVVIEAAQRGYKAVGYEINPFLVLMSYFNSAVRSKRRASQRGTATFHWLDIWKVKTLHEADVIFVYGLGPIMDALSEKIAAEARPNVFIVSYVFQLKQPNVWNLVYTNTEKNIHVYQRRCCDVPSSSGYIL
jgi:hypothetical protein